MGGLLVYENRVVKYAVDKVKTSIMIIKCRRGRMTPSEKEDISEKRIATGAAKIDNL